MKKAVFLLLVGCVFLVGSVYAADPLWWTPYGGEKSITSWADQVVSEFQTQTGTELKRVDMNDEDFKTGIQASFGAGNPPDLWYSWGGGVLKAYVGQGVVHDLTDLLNEDWAKERIPRSALGGSTFDGKHYGLPYTVWIGHLFINKGLFDKAGVAVPDADKGEVWTWGQFTEAIKKFQDNDIIPLSVGGAEKWELSFYYMYLVDRAGGSNAYADAMDRKPGASFNSDPFIKAGKCIQEMVDLNAFQPGFLGSGYSDGQRVFAAGQAAMYLMGSWAVSDIKAINPEIELDVIAFPTLPDGTGDPSMVLGAVQTNFCISEASPFKDELREFLKFLGSPEMIKAFVEKVGDIIVFSNVDLPADAFHPVIQKQMRLMQKASFMQMAYDQLSPPAFATEHLDAVAGVFAKQLTPEQAAEMQEAKAQSLE